MVWASAITNLKSTPERVIPGQSHTQRTRRVFKRKRGIWACASQGSATRISTAAHFIESWTWNISVACRNCLARARQSLPTDYGVTLINRSSKQLAVL
eukprot:6181531-Pleurochrysis_carterae.AAC.3